MSELVRRTQATAIEQAWPVDWVALTNARRQMEEARAAANPRETLHHLGEAIALLGVGGRLHRKTQGAAPVT